MAILIRRRVPKVVMIRRFEPPLQPPVLLSVSPNTGPIAGGTAVTLTGYGFTGATASSLLQPGFTVVNDTTITGVTVAGAVGVVSATVSNSLYTSAPLANAFTYLAATLPVAPTAIINVNAPLPLGDASGGSLAEITVAASAGLTGAYLTDGATHYPLTGFSIVDGTHVQGTVPAIPASSTLLSLVVQNASGDSPPLANAWESFWPTNFTIARILFWLRADKGVTGTTWTDQAHGHVFSGTTVATDNAGINGKARIVCHPQSAANTLTCAGLTSAATKGQAFAVGKLAGTFLNTIWELAPSHLGNLFPFNGNDIYEDGLSNTRYGPQASALTSGGAYTYEIRADAAGNWAQLLNASVIATQTGNTVAWDLDMTVCGNKSGQYEDGESEEFLVLVDNLTNGEHARYSAYILDRYGLAA